MLNLMVKHVWSCLLQHRAQQSARSWWFGRSMPSSKWIVPVVLHLWTRYAPYAPWPWEFHLRVSALEIFAQECQTFHCRVLQNAVKRSAVSFRAVLGFCFISLVSSCPEVACWWCGFSLLPLLWVLSCIWIRTCRTRVTTAPIRGEQRGAMLWLPFFTKKCRNTFPSTVKVREELYLSPTWNDVERRTIPAVWSLKIVLHPETTWSNIHLIHELFWNFGLFDFSAQCAVGQFGHRAVVSLLFPLDGGQLPGHGVPSVPVGSSWIQLGRPHRQRQRSKIFVVNECCSGLRAQWSDVRKGKTLQYLALRTTGCSYFATTPSCIPSGWGRTGMIL